MRGILADVNVEGNLEQVVRLLDELRLRPLLTELGLGFWSFDDFRIARDSDDRVIWNRCQSEGLVLLTDNRNKDGVNSLQAALDDSWRQGCLPVLTLANKPRFERDPIYATRIAAEIADLLFGIADGENLNLPRIYVPR